MGRTKQTARTPVGTRKKKLRLGMKRSSVELDAAPFAFVQTDLLDPECVNKLHISNPQLIVTDCPWPSNTLASNHDSTTYKLATKVRRGAAARGPLRFPLSPPCFLLGGARGSKGAGTAPLLCDQWGRA